MSTDSKLAIVLVAYFLAVISMRQFCENTLEALLKLTRTGATVALLGMIALGFHKGYPHSAMVGILISAYLLRDLWTAWPRSDARRLYLDVGRDQARFNPMTSVDLQWANGTAVHDSPNMREKHETESMLVFPPSGDTLSQMCGS